MGPMKQLNRVVHKIADCAMFWIVGDDSTYIYNISWEDPRIDHIALKPKGASKYDRDDHVLTISSAGCNAFDYLIEGAQVTAVDFNFAQIALTELKARACMHLEFEDFFQIFAQDNVDLLRERYRGVIREHLSAKSRVFWDRKLPAMRTIFYSGTAGWLGFLMVRVLFPAFGLGFIRKTVALQQDLDAFREQCRRYKRRLLIFARVFDMLFSQAGFAMMAGVPSRQLELGLHRPDNFQTVAKRLLATDMVEDNYFYFAYLAGHLTATCCPRYLKPEHFATLKAALRGGRLSLLHGTLVDACRPSPPAECFAMGSITASTRYTVASLLDHMDWMPPAMINEELHWLSQRMDPARGRCFWRSFSESVHSAPLCWLAPRRVDDATDRAATYWSTWAAPFDPSLRFHRRAPPPGAAAPSPLPQPRKASARGPPSPPSPALPLLADCVPLRAVAGKMLWVGVGGGTVRLLDSFDPKTLQETFARIVLVESDPRLLEDAQSAVAAAGLQGVVECVSADLADMSPAATACLPAAGSCDLVTFAYALSTAPDQPAALRGAARLLKPRGEGVLGVADAFFGGGKRAAHGRGDEDGITNLLSRAYCEATRLWFRRGGVRLLEQRVFCAVEAALDLGAVPGERFRKSVPGLPLLRPWHGVLVAPTK